MTTYYFKVIALMALFAVHCSRFALAGEPANYDIVPLPQSIVEQKGDPGACRVAE